MSFGSQINYKQLLDRHERIWVPMIQRDYAQGRPAEMEVREEFLKTLKDALCKPADDPSLPLNLDFIYGSVEGDTETRFLPLDGQQRLTTLFLLHWYLAWKDDQWSAFEQMFLSDGRSRFTYSVRPSSNEFFDQLVTYRPSADPVEVNELADLIADQSWYFRSWRLDPTIQAILHMLNAIHNKFRELNGLFARLIDEEKPSITFQLLDLENFGLSDDLYIKMNARGKPLTAFETFKARYEQELRGQFEGDTFLIGEQSFCTAEYIARRMDTTWADLFWKHRNAASDLYDEAFMNVFRAIALITRVPDSSDYIKDISRLRNGTNPPSYADFHASSWLDERFTRSLLSLLDTWCGNGCNGSKLNGLLPNSRYFDEKVFFHKIVSNGANLSYTELIQLTAYAHFIVAHQNGIEVGAFQEWMRIIQNLVLNTGYNRPEDFRRSVRGEVELLTHSKNILTHFAQTEKAATGFSELQIAEEKLKAELILAHDSWRGLIDRAEGHGYFRGQIGFLLDFSGIVARRCELEPNRWDSSEHLVYQKNFMNYLQLAEIMFSADGLNDAGEYIWQRALLSLGDYLLPSGRNRSFLVNAVTEEASWKRLLGGSGLRAAAARTVLKGLWEKLLPESDILTQLKSIIEVSQQLDSWREAIVHCPEVLDYCKRNSIRVSETGAIYLLKRSQMNGTHAELFTFCLQEKLNSRDINLSSLKASYESVKDTYSEPHVVLRCTCQGTTARLMIEYQNDSYLIKAPKQENSGNAVLDELLRKEGFTEVADCFQINISHSAISEYLHHLDASIISNLDEVDHA